jgi:hypothetical protein
MELSAIEEESVSDPRADELRAAYEVIQDQKAQMKALMDAYSSQIHWAHEWRVQCHDNIRLRAILKSKDEGTEVLELRQQLVDTTAELASFRAAYQQRGILLSNALNEVRLLMAENRRLRAK